jgi:hypothetical protein
MSAEQLKFPNLGVARRASAGRPQRSCGPANASARRAWGVLPCFQPLSRRSRSTINVRRTIVVESPDRFARNLMVQLAGHDMLKARGVTLIAASAPMHFVEDTHRCLGVAGSGRARGGPGMRLPELLTIIAD